MSATAVSETACSPTQHMGVPALDDTIVDGWGHVWKIMSRDTLPSGAVSFVIRRLRPEGEFEYQTVRESALTACGGSCGVSDRYAR